MAKRLRLPIGLSRHVLRLEFQQGIQFSKSAFLVGLIQYYTSGIIKKKVSPAGKTSLATKGLKSSVAHQTGLLRYRDPCCIERYRHATRTFIP